MNRKEIKKMVLNGFKGFSLENFNIPNNVETAIFTGSYGRRTNDRLSDIDIVLLVDNKKNFCLGGKFLIKDALFDFRTEDFKKIQGKWSEDQIFAFLNSEIIFDRKRRFYGILNNQRQGFIKSIKNRIAIELVELSVLFKFEDNWRNLKTEKTHFEKSLERRQIETAAHIQNLMIDRIINLIYLINYQPIPDKKNKFFLLRGLLSKKEYAQINSLFVVRELTKECLIKRYKDISQIVNLLKKKVDKKIKTNLNLKEIYLKERT